MNRSDIHIDWVQFSPGVECCEFFRSGQHEYQSHRRAMRPPADWLDPTCETCEGRGIRFVDRFGQVYGNRLADELKLTLTIPCPADCIDGLRRIAVTEPCETCVPHRASSTVIDDCPDCGLRSLVTVAHVVQDWGPVQVVDIRYYDGGPAVVIHYDGSAWLTTDGQLDRLGLPPDVDPASLVGQWARGGRVVSPPVQHWTA